MTMLVVVNTLRRRTGQAQMAAMLVVGSAVLAACGSATPAATTGSTPTTTSAPRGGTPRYLAGFAFDNAGRLQPSSWTIVRGVVSPDGVSVAVIGTDASGAPAIGVASHGTPVAVTGHDVVPTDLAWMPDSSSLLVAYRPAGAASSTPEQFAVVDLHGHVTRGLSLDRPLDSELDMGMVVRPDGKEALISGRAPDTQGAPVVYRVELASGHTAVAAPHAGTAQEMPSYWHDTLAVIAEHAWPNTAASGSAVLLDLGSGSLRPLTGTDQVVGSASVAYAGRSAFYDARPAGSGDAASDLWTVDLLPSGAGHRLELHASHVRYPAASPVGVFVVVADDSGRGGLFLAPAV
jgi:hypothetical protein